MLQRIGKSNGNRSTFSHCLVSKLDNASESLHKTRTKADNRLQYLNLMTKVEISDFKKHHKIEQCSLTRIMNCLFYAFIITTENS